MSAMVELCVNELAKLKEMVQVRARKPFRSEAKSKPTSELGREGELKEKLEKESTLSEATVCLLMDRFAPWWYCVCNNNYKYEGVLTLYSFRNVCFCSLYVMLFVYRKGCLKESYTSFLICQTHDCFSFPCKIREISNSILSFWYDLYNSRRQVGGVYFHSGF